MLLKSQNKRGNRMKKIFCLFAAVCLIGGSAIAQEEGQSYKYEFARDYVEGLGYLKKIREMDRIGRPPERLKDKKEFINDYMEDIRRARADMIEMRKTMAAYEVPRDPEVRRAAILTVKSYDVYIQCMDKILEKQGQLWSASDEEFNPNPLIRSISEQYPKMNEAMNMLSDCSVLVTHAILDTRPDERGKLTYLGISSRERKALISSLDDIYGDDIEGGMREDQPKIDQCGAILVQGLTGVHKSSDERAKGR
jgi:hypothetical protein